MRTSLQNHKLKAALVNVCLAIFICALQLVMPSDSRSHLKYYQLSVGSAAPVSMSGANILWESGGQGSRYWGLGGSSGVINLGFTFKFDGTNYTQVRVHSTGVITMGTASLGDPISNSLTVGVPLIAPFWEDLKFTGPGDGNWGCGWYSNVSYHTVGAAPNRIFVVEWADLEAGYQELYGYNGYNGGNRASFQAQIHENGNIVFYYHEIEGKPSCGWVAAYYSNETKPNISASIGLGISSTNFLSVTPGGTPTTSSTTSNDNINITGSTTIGGGTNYTFTKLPEVRMSATPKIIDYGTVSAGAYAEANVVIKHVSTEGVLNVLAATISGPGSSQYSVQSTPGPLNPGQQANLVVRFTPTLNGTHTATLTIVSNGVDSGVQTILLSGMAVAPTIEIIPIGSVNTPNRMFKKTRTLVGDSLTQSFLVKNVGAGTLVINPWSGIVGEFASHYTLSRWPLYPVSAGNTDTMSVTFAPTQDGGLPARLELYNNATNGTQYIDLFGVGVVPAIQLEPGEMLTFDSVAMGVTTCKTVRISNPGTDTLRLTHNYLSSSDGDFSYTPLVGSDTAIAPGTFRDVTVCITPLQKGTRRARLRFTTNIPLTFEDGGNNQEPDHARNIGQSQQENNYYPEWIRNDTSAKSLEIWANAIPSDKTIIAMGDFSDGIIGTEATATATFTNAGSEMITVEEPFFSGTSASIFKATKANFPLDLAPGASVNFTVAASPKVRGEHTAVMNIANKSEDRQYLQSVNVSIKGLLASSTINETSLTYEKLYLGEESSKSVTVTNAGDIDQTYTATLTDANGFRVDGSSVVGPLTPGSSVNFSVKFIPTSKGTITNTLTVKTAHTSDMTVSLTGEADEKPVTQSVKGEVSMKGFVLSQNSPNPASGTTSFSFTTPSTSAVRIMLADVTGKTVRELASGTYDAGAHTVNVKTDDIASGSYVYILESDGVRLVRQMVIAK